MPKGFNFMLADRSKQHTLAEWEALGLRRPGNKSFPHPQEKAYLLVPAGHQGPGFLMLHNFRVIMKYNPAEAYALAIGHLADRFRGGEAFAQPGRGMSRCFRATSAASFRNSSTRRASTPASRTAASGRRPASRCATTRLRSGRFPTVSPPPQFSARLRGR